MSKFIDRIDDLAFLETEYARPGASLVVLYGRRRVGKTALIAEFGKQKPMLYFMATEESAAENRDRFRKEVAAFTDNALLQSAIVSDWIPLFTEVAKEPHEHKVIIAIDEFQYLGKSNPAFLSILQNAWDTMLRNCNVMLILCGSLITMMESQTLSYDSPLYGRRTGQIKLGPVAFPDYAAFYPRKSKKELVEYYSVTGGVPKYIEMFRDEPDIYEAIDANVLSARSFLYEEPTFLLRNEVSEIGSYFSLLKAISAGNEKLGDIAATLGVKQTGLTRYLRTLIDLDVLERQVPVTEENPAKSKKGLYRIKDNYFAFWFKFVYPYRDVIETGHPEKVSALIRKELIARHTAYVYETVCLQELWRMQGVGKLPFVFASAGRWWSGTEEIDIVAYDPSGSDILFCECKYTEKPLDMGVWLSLRGKKDLVKWKNDQRTEYFGFFSINGFSPQMKALAKSEKNILLFG